MSNGIYYCTYCHNDWSQIGGGHPHECPACGKDDIREIIVNFCTSAMGNPIRDFDRYAHFDSEEETGHYGWGPDRNTAINDLIANFGE